MQSRNSRRPGLALLAGVIALGITADSARSQNERGNAAQLGGVAMNYSQNIMGACMNIWSVNNQSVLADYSSKFNSAVSDRVDVMANERRELVEEVKMAEANAKTADDHLTGSALLEMQAREQSGGKAGIASGPEAAALAAQLWNGLNIVANRQAVQRLTMARARLEQMDRRLWGWRAFSTAVNACIDDQKRYLAKGGRVATPQAQSGNQGTQDARTIRNTFYGVWIAQCAYEGIPAHTDGRFDLQLDGTGRIAAGFVDGSPATITGTIDSSGRLNGSGRVPMENKITDFTMSGTVGRATDGSLKAKGTFSASYGAELNCQGDWSSN